MFFSNTATLQVWCKNWKSISSKSRIFDRRKIRLFPHFQWFPHCWTCWEIPKCVSDWVQSESKRRGSRGFWKFSEICWRTRRNSNMPSNRRPRASKLGRLCWPRSVTTNRASKIWIVKSNYFEMKMGTYRMRGKWQERSYLLVELKGNCLRNGT